MLTTKNQQIQGLIFGGISLVLPNLSAIISNATKNNSSAAVGGVIAVVILCIAALVLGIIGIVKSSGARKAATAAGEPKVLGTIGFVASIVGTVLAAIYVFLFGFCAACVVCAAASIASAY